MTNKEYPKFNTLETFEKISLNEYTDISCSIVEIEQENKSTTNHLKISKIKKDQRGYLVDEKQIFLPVHSWLLIKDIVPSLDNYFK